MGGITQGITVTYKQNISNNWMDKVLHPVRKKSNLSLLQKAFMDFAI